MEIQYKNKSYYTEDLTDKKKVFLFHDKDLTKLAKVNGKTLMVRVNEIEEHLIK